MEITWLGHASFRLKGREATVITDPYSPTLGYAIGKPAATIVTVSHQHPGHSYTAAVGGEPHIVDGPGEYEIAGVFITGIATYHDTERGQLRGRNTVFLIELDEVTVCHLGDLGHVPSAEQTETMNNVDVLLIPVGGKNSLNATGACETISLLEPKIVIPMHYKTEAVKAELDPLDKFLKEMGVKEAAPQPKLSVSKSSLPAQTTVVLLEPRRG
ncbi:MAG: lactamase [Chloroflexota bacterium]|nr:MAG: lactamase [Chloroflexota bacterium]